MSDAFGGLAIPLVLPDPRDSAGDPLLSKSLSFFKAILNANAPVGWRAVFKDAPATEVVKTTAPDDPKGGPFNERDLPALFMWREAADPAVWIADDWLTQKSTCRLIWVPPWATSTKRAIRTAIYNAIARVLLVIVERNRDPSWFDEGDLDPLSPTLGSSFFGRAGWMEFEIGRWKPDKLPITMLGKSAKPQVYEALSIECTVVEKLNIDLTRYDANGGLDLTLKTPDGGVGDGGFITDHTTLP